MTVERIHENLHDYKKKNNDSSLKFYIGASTAADSPLLETVLDQGAGYCGAGKEKGANGLNARLLSGKRSIARDEIGLENIEFAVAIYYLG